MRPIVAASKGVTKDDRLSTGREHDESLSVQAGDVFRRKTRSNCGPLWAADWLGGGQFCLLRIDLGAARPSEVVARSAAARSTENGKAGAAALGQGR
jgi:hypothetical protein